VHYSIFVTNVGQKRHARNVLFGKPGGKSLLRMQSLSRDNSFKMDINPYPANVENMVSS